MKTKTKTLIPDMRQFVAFFVLAAGARVVAGGCVGPAFLPDLLSLS